MEKSVEKESKLNLLNLFTRKGEIAELIASVPDDVEGFCIIELQDENRFCRWEGVKDDAGAFAEKLLKLSLFNADHFVTIEARDDSGVVLVSNMDGFGADPIFKMPYYSACNREWFLWGKVYKKDKGKFFENIIPKMHEYPLESRFRVKIEGTEYLDAYGNAVFFRFQSIRGIDEEKNEGKNKEKDK